MVVEWRCHCCSEFSQVLGGNSLGMTSLFLLTLPTYIRSAVCHCGPAWVSVCVCVCVCVCERECVCVCVRLSGGYSRDSGVCVYLAPLEHPRAHTYTLSLTHMLCPLTPE